MGDRVIRKRNVKSRDRTGCVTCRARRLKCDEGKPECGNVSALSHRCVVHCFTLKGKKKKQRVNISAHNSALGCASRAVATHNALSSETKLNC